MTLRIIFLSFIIVFATACSSPKSKLTKNDISNSTRIIYGKIKDLNPESLLQQLQFSYVLSEKSNKGPFSSLDKYPNAEPNSDFFWISVSSDTTYFGVSTLQFAMRGVDGTAMIRDAVGHKPLFGVNFPAGTSPVYIGEITIRSGLRKYGVGLEVEGFDLKEAFIKYDMAEAKAFLEENGIETRDLVNVPFKIKTFQQATSRSSRALKL